MLEFYFQTQFHHYAYIKLVLAYFFFWVVDIGRINWSNILANTAFLHVHFQITCQKVLWGYRHLCLAISLWAVFLPLAIGHV
jgi:hypothetical protein